MEETRRRLPLSVEGDWTSSEPRALANRLLDLRAAATWRASPLRRPGRLVEMDFRWVQGLGDGYELDEAATRDLIAAFAQRAEVEKILLEPHLRARLGITNSKVRFQGCDAARHDDHFHVQFR